MNGYKESQLINNRASVLLYGATEAERLAWAQEAAQAFAEEGALFEARDEKTWPQLLNRTKGVAFVPDVTKLEPSLQRQLAWMLNQKEERAKLVLGLSLSPETAANKGLLREDLAYRLSKAQVNLGDSEVKAEVKKRRAKQKPKRG